MKKFYSLLLLLAACTIGASAQLAELQGKKIATVGVAITADAITENQWYLLRNVGRNAYVVSYTDNGLMHLQTPGLTADAYAGNPETAGRLVRFVDANQFGAYHTHNHGYYIQNGFGSYFKHLTQGSNTGATTNQSEAAVFTYNAIGTETKVAFYDETGNKKMDGNAAGGTLAGWDSGNYHNSPTGNAAYEVLPVTLADVSTYEVTINHIYQGQTLISESKTAMEGSTLAAAGVAPLTRYGLTSSVDNDLTTTTVSAATTVNITYTDGGDAYPFLFSTVPSGGSFDSNTKWYKMTIRGTKKVGYNLATNFTNNNATADNTKPAFFFAFSGNPLTGFRIYNYAVGAQKTLWSKAPTNNSSASFISTGELSENDGFLLTKNGNGFVLRANNHNLAYINDVNSTLGFWMHTNAATDGGSTITFTEVPAEEITAADAALLADAKAVYNPIKAEAQYIVDNNDPSKAGHFTDVEALRNALPNSEPATVEEYLSAAQNMSQIIALLQLAPITEDIYTLKVADRAMKDGTTQTLYLALNENNKTVATENVDGAHKYWRLISDGNNYQFQNVSNDQYLPAPTANASSTSQSAPVALPVIKTGKLGKIAFGGPDRYKYYHADDVNRAVAWEAASVASQWEIEKVENITVTLASELEGYATFSAPFATTIPQGVEAFTAQKDGESLTLTLVNASELPGKTPVVIKGTAGDSYVFARSMGSDAPLDNNELTAALTPFTTPLDTYTLQSNGDGVGFYPYTGATLVGFKAYLTHTAPVPVQGFTFNGHLTKIESAATAAQPNAPIFDLQGRRVQRAQSGLYIVGGKKVLVK